MTAVTVAGAGASSNGLGAPVALRRRLRNRAYWLACGGALAFVVGPVVWILSGVISRAAGHVSWAAITTTWNGTGGGLSNAIMGTVALIVGVGALAGVVGVGCGIHLAESAQTRRAVLLRSASEVLAGVPSIVFGYVGYVALVVYFHWGYSIWAAVIVLSVLVVPYVAKATESAIRGVPGTYREAAEALGMRRTQMMRRIVLRAALPGISTGVVVALAVSVGETAPLLYTAGWSNNYPTFGVHNSPVGYLTYAVWTFWDQPSTSVNVYSQVAALFLVVIVLALILSARLVVRLTQRYAPPRGARG